MSKARRVRVPRTAPSIQPVLTPVAAELQTQRDFVLHNTWKRGFPYRTGEACLIYRRDEDRVKLSDKAVDMIEASLSVIPRLMRLAPIAYNDLGPGFGKRRVVRVLNRAVKKATREGI
jgi:hypothetical protein